MDGTQPASAALHPRQLKGAFPRALQRREVRMLRGSPADRESDPELEVHPGGSGQGDDHDGGEGGRGGGGGAISLVSGCRS